MTGMKDQLGDRPYVAPAKPFGHEFSETMHRLCVKEIPAEVLGLFERFALEASKTQRRYSADAILHRIRWHEQIECGRPDFKCNNNWTSTLARWFMKKHPSLDGFFATRESKADG